MILRTNLSSINVSFFHKTKFLTWLAENFAKIICSNLNQINVLSLVGADDGLVEAKSIVGNQDMTLYEIIEVLIQCKEQTMGTTQNQST